MPWTQEAGGRIAVLVAAAALGGAGCASPPSPADGIAATMPPAPGMAAAAGEPAPVIDASASIDDYVRHAFLNNAGLKAAFARWRAAGARARQARSLDDPSLTYEYSLTQYDFLHRFSLQQMIPGFGKLGLRESRARAGTEAARHAFESARVRLYGDILKAFYEYDFLRRATEVTTESLRLLTDIETVVRTRYEAGTAGFSDLTKAQVEADRLRNDLAGLRDERTARSAALAALLNLPDRGLLPWPTVAPSAPGLLSDDALLDMLRDLNPELRGGDAMAAARDAALRLARRERYPDFMLGAGAMVMPGMAGASDRTEVGAMAGITLPLWQGRRSTAIREAYAEREAAEHERDDMERRLAAELKMAIFKARDAERRVDLFAGSLMPKAEQAYEVARQDFAGGKAPFMTLIDAQRTLLDFRLMRERALVDREIALGEIGCCVGRYGVPVAGHVAEPAAGRDAAPPPETEPRTAP